MMKLLMLKVLVVVVYFFLDKYVFIDYLCLQKEKKLSLSHIVFGDTLFYELSGIWINIVSS